MVLFPCSSCCGCAACQYSRHDCLTLTLSGFSASPEAVGCDECSHIDGEYVLRRGIEDAELTVRIAATTGSGAVIAATLSKDPETHEYTIASVLLVSPGSGYSPDAHFEYTITNAALSPCRKRPCPAIA